MTCSPDSLIPSAVAKFVKPSDRAASLGLSLRLRKRRKEALGMTFFVKVLSFLRDLF
jgi:hypothetical protein